MTQRTKHKIVLRGQIRKEKKTVHLPRSVPLLSGPQRTEECDLSQLPHPAPKQCTLGSRLKEACLRHLELSTNAKRGKYCTGEVLVVTMGLVLLTGPAMAREVGGRVLSQAHV